MPQPAETGRGAPEGSIWTFLSRLTQESRAAVLLSAGTGILSGLCGAGVAGVMGKAIGSGTSAPVRLGIAFFLLCVVFFGLKSVSELLLEYTTQRAVLNLREMLARKLLGTTMAKLDSLGKPQLLAILTSDVSTIVEACQTVPQMYGNVVVTLACSSYMVWLSPKLFIVFLVILAGGVLSFNYAHRSYLQKFRDLREHIDELYKGLRSLVEGAKELKMNAKRREFFLREDIVASAERARQMNNSAMFSFIWANNISVLLFYIAIGLLLFVAPSLVTIDTANTVPFVVVLMFLMRPISWIMNAMPILGRAGVSWKKVHGLELALSDSPLFPDALDPFGASAGIHLELNGVTHRRAAADSDNCFALGPIDLNLRSGEVVYIVGGNGCGKTTLSMLILGLYSPNEGAISLNGVRVTSANVDQYRQHFSGVFSDCHLFERLFDPAVSGAAVRAMDLLAQFGMSDHVSVRDGRLMKLDLSTGQRKRLVLISAYLEDRPVLIFDEWAAEQDPQFRSFFYTTLLPKLKAKGKAVMVITHDDHFYQYADRIIKLDFGALDPSMPSESDTAIGTLGHQGGRHGQSPPSQRRGVREGGDHLVDRAAT